MVIRTSKRTQHCTFCKNHGLSEPKKGHQCPYANCPCLLCKLTKKAQVAMRHQQRVWRHQKQKLKFQGSEDDLPAGEKSSKGQACDKCRNHNIIKAKRNHECPFQSCDCEYCSLTFKRREIMKHQQRVRRSRIMSQVESDGKESNENSVNIKDDEDEATGNDTDNNSSKDCTYEKEFDNASSDCMDTMEDTSSRASPVQLLSLPVANNSKEFESLSSKFSSLEAEYPIGEEPDLEPINMELNSDLGATGSDMTISSPPPLLPLDGDKSSSPEDFRFRNQAYSPPASYEISHRNRISLESQNDPYKNPLPYPQGQGFQMLESSQISTFMLLQSERYVADPSPRGYSIPRPAQQSSGSLKITMDQACINRAVNIPLQPTENRFNHSTVASSFTNYSPQSPPVIFQQREYESQHPQQLQQLHRQHHRQPFRVQHQRDQEQLYPLSYFHQAHLNSQ